TTNKKHETHERERAPGVHGQENSAVCRGARQDGGAAGLRTGADDALWHGGLGAADFVHERGESAVGESSGEAAGVRYSVGDGSVAWANDEAIIRGKLPVCLGRRGTGTYFGRLDNEHFDGCCRF